MSSDNWITTIEDKPSLAPSNFLELAPVTRVDNNEYDNHSIWQGSGFWIKDLPIHFWWYDETETCCNCQSKNSVAIYVDHDVCQTGKEIHLETYCRDCKKITYWKGYD